MGASSPGRRNRSLLPGGRFHCNGVSRRAEYSSEVGTMDDLATVCTRRRRCGKIGRIDKAHAGVMYSQRGTHKSF